MCFLLWGREAGRLNPEPGNMIWRICPSGSYGPDLETVWVGGGHLSPRFGRTLRWDFRTHS